MKTTIVQVEKNKIGKDIMGRFFGVLMFLLFLIMLLGANSLFSQNGTKQGYKLGLGAASGVSGNAHGIIYDVSTHLYNGKNLFGIGACIQKRKESLCGFKINYMHFITGKEKLVNGNFESKNGYSRSQLFFYSSMQFIKNGYLSFGAVKREEVLYPKSEIPSDFSNFKLSTAEACVGFGINIKITEQLVWSNYIGFGAYYHLNYTKPMYTEKAAPMLVLGTALRLNYFKN
jgi:hypothetical protein